MASKAVTIGDLIHRVASSCLSNRFPGNYTLDDGSDLDEEDDDPFADFGDAADAEECRRSPPAKAAPRAEEEGDDEVRKLKIWEEGEEEKRRKNVSAVAPADEVKEKERVERAGDAEELMAEVFDAVSGVRRAYAALQGAHCPWDPDRMRAADAGVVAELRHLARLRDRFRRSAASPGGRIPRPSAQPLREAVAPYEAELDDLRRQLQGKQAEVDGLKEKLATATSRRNARLHPSKKHLHHNADTGGVGAPTAELFVACAEQARAATRGFAGHLLNLLRAAGLDPAAATRSITKIPVNSSPHLAKHALEAHATAVLLGGFEHESFYLDGSLSSLLDPAAFRRERYAQYRDMRGMDPGELLGVLPTRARRSTGSSCARPRRCGCCTCWRSRWSRRPATSRRAAAPSSTRSTWRASSRPAVAPAPAPRAWSSGSRWRPGSSYATPPWCAPGSTSCPAAADSEDEIADEIKTRAGGDLFPLTL